MFQMLGVFAEFERGIIRERVNAGLARARANGTQLGRRRAKPSVEARIKELRAKGDGILKIGRTLGIGTSVVQRVISAIDWLVGGCTPADLEIGPARALPSSICQYSPGRFKNNDFPSYPVVRRRVRMPGALPDHHRVVLVRSKANFGGIVWNDICIPTA